MAHEHPLDNKITEPFATPPSSALSLPMQQILVVDDEPFLRWNAERLLTDAGFRVVTAQDGQHALEVYQEAGPGAISLVILDYRMPVMDGLEAFERLREIDPEARVLINSASLETSKLEELIDAGALGAIPKPYTKQEYLTAVQTALNEAPALPRR